MRFDRYEIHIQDFVDLLRGSSSFPGARLRRFIFQNPQIKQFKFTKNKQQETNNKSNKQKQKLENQKRMSHYKIRISTIQKLKMQKAR